MITKIKETNEIIKHKNIDEASNNFKNISSKVKNQKFEHIDAWLDEPLDSKTSVTTRTV